MREPPRALPQMVLAKRMGVRKAWGNGSDGLFDRVGVGRRKVLSAVRKHVYTAQCDRTPTAEIDSRIGLRAPHWDIKDRTGRLREHAPLLPYCPR
jgi:hypothetical protein